MNHHLEDDDDLDTAPIADLEALRAPREPEHDLWPAIAARIAPPAQVRLPRRRSRLRNGNGWMLAVAASLIAVIGGVIGLQQWQQPVAVQTELQTAALSAPTLQSASADNAYRTLQGPNRALVKANLKIVSSAESQLRQAIAADPDDPDIQYLKRLLLSAQGQSDELRALLDHELPRERI